MNQPHHPYNTRSAPSSAAPAHRIRLSLSSRLKSEGGPFQPQADRPCVHAQKGCGDLWHGTLVRQSATASPGEYEEYFGSFIQTFWNRPLGLPHQCSPAPLRPRRDPVPRCRWCVEAPLASAREPGRPRPHPSQRPDKADSSHTAGERDHTPTTTQRWHQRHR